MSTLALILLARAVHVLGGVFWAGSTLLMTWVIFPIGARHAAEGGASWLDEIRRKAGPMAGVSALLTVLSGIYLMVVLHPHDASPQRPSASGRRPRGNPVVLRGDRAAQARRHRPYSDRNVDRARSAVDGDVSIRAGARLI